MENNPKDGVGVTKSVDRLPETVLFLYQPQGVEDSVTVAKLVAWEVPDTKTASGRRIVTVSIGRGVNLVKYQDFLRISADPECGELFRRRSLIRICDGSNPFAPRDKASGVYGEINNDAVIERTYRRDLLEGWENWLKQQDWEQLKSSEYGSYLQKVRDRIALIDKSGKGILPTYNPEYPEIANSSSRLPAI